MLSIAQKRKNVINILERMLSIVTVMSFRCYLQIAIEMTLNITCGYWSV